MLLARNSVPPMSRPADEAVLVFLDVDGVLNADWHGVGLGRAENLAGEDIEPKMVAALATLLRRIEAEVAPVRLVLSSTWRLSAPRTARLQEQLRAAGVPPGCLAQMDATPRLGGCDGTDPEGRAQEIGAWLSAERALREQAGPSRRAPLFLVLDDLDLLVDSTGRPIVGPVRHMHLVHTEPRLPRAPLRGPCPPDQCGPGLTPSRVLEALVKLKQQTEARALDQSKTGQYTADEWEILQGSGLPLDVLKTQTCPLWIKEGARRYLASARAHEQPTPERRWLCTSWCACCLPRALSLLSGRSAPKACPAEERTNCLK